MAILLEQYLPFDSGPGANVQESGWREMMKHMLGSASGVIRGFDNDFNTFGDSSGMQVKVNTGQCWIRGHFGKSTTLKTLSIAAAHATLARKDVVIIRADFGDNEIEVDVLTGTAAASPVAPSLTQNADVWETQLAEVNVPAAAVTIAAGNVTDRRMYTTVVAKYSRSTGQSINNSAQTDVQYTTVEFQAGEVVANATNSVFTLNRAGLWALSANGGFVASAGGARSLIIKDGSGATSFSETTILSAGSGSSTIMNTSTLERFSAGQTVKVVTHQSSGAALNTTGTQQFNMMWVGP
jgi:fructose-specific phosphotransferase system component IIB